MTMDGTQHTHCKMIDFATLRVAGRNRELMEDGYGAVIVPLLLKPGDRRSPSCIEELLGEEDPDSDDH